MTSTTVDALKVVLADSYTLYLKTQNYHWNVTGPQFKSLHLLFEEQYTDLAAAIDEIAERIRALGAKAPATFQNFHNLRSLQDGNENASAERMVQELADDQGRVVASLKNLLSTAQKGDDEATVDLAIQRIAVHEKNAWMLKSSL